MPRKSRALPVTVLATAVLSLSLARADAAGMSVADIARLRLVDEVAVSPDGERIAYVVRVPRDPFGEENGPAWAELHLLDADGRSRPYVAGKVEVDRIAWTPNGRGISFLARHEDKRDRALRVIPVAGGESRLLLTHEEEIGSYAFSPDGRRIAFSAKEPKGQQRKDLEKKGFDQEIFEEDWRHYRLWLVDLDEHGTAGNARALDLPGSAYGPKWSPDGKRIVVSIAPTPSVDDRYMKRRLRIVDVESGRIVGEIDNPGKLGKYEFAPDGRSLTLISGIDIHDPKEGRLMSVPAGGGTPRELLPGYPGHVRSFAFQGDGSVVYVGDVGVWTTVERIDRGGEKRETLVPKETVVLSDVSLSLDGSVAAFVGETPQHPAEVFRLDGGGEPQRMTDSNRWLSDVALARQEVVRFEARDGLEIEGILVHPLDERPGTRYPLVMIVHGGPESHHRNGWQTSYSRPAQALAARGFAVFFTNYRGSTGRGVEFSKISQGDFAGREFEDLVDAVDHLVERGLVDRNRVGVTGGSYGGFATAWLSTYHTERFAAGVMSVGISDLLSKVGTSDIPNELYQVHMRMHVWDDWERMLERSPIRHVEQARTPLLILHGKKDPRVFPGQSLELYRYLKILGKVPVRLVWYPDEEHGNRKAAARLDYSLRLVRWMEHYLEGPGGDPPAYPVDYR